jgi:regulatory protein
MWPSNKGPGHSDGFDDDEPFESNDAPTGHRPSADAESHTESRSGSLTGARTRSRTESSIGARAAPRTPSRLSDFATGRSFDPPESAEASEIERKPGREKPKRSLKMRAIGFLSRREYSRVELERKLKPYVEADEEGEATASPTESLESVLDSLEREGWLSDQRFTQSVVHRRSGRFGTSRIIGELKRNAVDSELVQQVASELRDTEPKRAYAVWAKKFSNLPTTPAERAKQARFLASRGFSSAAITAVLKGGEWLEEAGGDIGD